MIMSKDMQFVPAQKQREQFVNQFAEDITKFILIYRTGDAFKDWSGPDIKASVLEAIIDNTLLIHIDPKLEIPVGVILCQKLNGTKEIRVSGLIIKKAYRRRGILGGWLKQMREKYPDWTLCGERHGKEFIYTDQMLDSIITKGL